MRKRHVWTQAELAFLKANAPLMKDREIAAALSRLGSPLSYFQVRNKRQALGLEKEAGHAVCRMKPAAS